MRATEASIAAVNETKESLYNSNRQYEKTVESVKTQLQEEIVSKNLVQQRLDTTQAMLDTATTKTVSTIKPLDLVSPYYRYIQYTVKQQST